MRTNSAFRPDIEGLRAISILAVLLFHAETPGFASGYVGVDAFFVISGFLITGILLREIERDNSVDLFRFWSRRAARLLPNGILTLLVTIAGIMTLSPVIERESGARDVASALLYYANFHFSARSLDYFDQGIQSSPVLHFWSLSVEEQFYACWPIVLILGLWLFGRLHRLATTWFLFGVAAASVGVMLYWAQVAPSRAFFDTESRVWQLAIGALLAVGRPTHDRLKRYSQAIGWGGILGLLLSVVLLDAVPLNPSIRSLIPALATAAALYGGSASPAYGGNAILANPVMQWIGKRSYSIYLWHWPLFVFVAPVIGHGASIVLVLAVAGLAFTWVEQPLRFAAPVRFAPWKLSVLAISVCCGVAGLAVALPHFDPAYSSARGEVLKRVIEAKNDGARMIRGTCKTLADAENGICAFGKSGGEKRIALFGDSHAQQLFDGFDGAAVSSGWELRVWVRGGCTPIDFPNGDPACKQLHIEAFTALAAYKPDLIVVSSANAGAVHLHDPQSGKRIEKQESLVIWKAGFRDTLTKLSAISPRVVVVHDTPVNAKRFGTECLENNAPASCVTPLAEALNADAPDVEVARSVRGIELLDLTDRFCDSRKCPAINDGVIVYRADNNHITATMSLRLAPDFVRLLEAQR